METVSVSTVALKRKQTGVLNGLGPCALPLRLPNDAHRCQCPYERVVRVPARADSCLQLNLHLAPKILPEVRKAETPRGAGLEAQAGFVGGWRLLGEYSRISAPAAFPDARPAAPQRASKATETR